MSRQNRNEVNYFASMTDMLVGFLFILIIMIAYFAFQIESEETVPQSKYDEKVKEVQKLERTIIDLRAEIGALKDEIERLRARLRNVETVNPLEKYLADGKSIQEQVVREIVYELKALDIDAEIGKTANVVTISGSNLFASGESSLESLDGAVERVNAIADVLTEKLKCFSLGSGLSDRQYLRKTCNPDLIFVEAVYVEGHTDNIQIVGRLSDGSTNNLELSSKRATNTYQQIVAQRPELKKFQNPGKQQALSVAAYGEQRPMADNTTKSGRAKNRRIDIRFDMYVPFDQEQLKKFKGGFGGSG